MPELVGTAALYQQKEVKSRAIVNHLVHDCLAVVNRWLKPMVVAGNFDRLKHMSATGTHVLEVVAFIALHQHKGVVRAIVNHCFTITRQS